MLVYAGGSWESRLQLTWSECGDQHNIHLVVQGYIGLQDAMGFDKKLNTGTTSPSPEQPLRPQQKSVLREHGIVIEDRVS